MPVKDPRHVKYLRDMFTIYMSDSSRTWHLDSEGNWTRHDTDDQATRCRMFSRTICVRVPVRTWSIRSKTSPLTYR